jgi:superfamily II DNA helicase RecQ
MQADARTHQFLISRSNPSPEHLQEVWNTLRDQAIQDPDSAYSIENLEEKFKRSQEPIDTPLRHFKTAQIIRVDSWSNTIEVNTNYLETNDVYQLPIDVQTLEQQRDHELQNLDKVLHFAQSSLCRHTYLLQYFGEGADGSCPQGARCDRCEPSSAAYRSSTQATGELSEDERRITLKALSGVARAKGVYGQTRVIEMLSGSNSARFQETFLKDLSTYGILTYLGADACKELIGILVSAGFCMIAPRILRNGEVSKYKSLQITPEGLKVMSGKADPTFRLERSWVQLEHQSHGKSHQSKPQPQSRSKPSRASTHKSSWASKSRSSESSTTRDQSTSTTKSPKSWRASVSSTTQSKSSSATSTKKSRGSQSTQSTQSTQSKRATATSSDEPSGLREELRRYRLSQARLREIPPFAVFSDAVLDALVDDHPQSQQSFLAIRGLGPAKWAQYGSDILEIIGNHTV